MLGTERETIAKTDVFIQAKVTTSALRVLWPLAPMTCSRLFVGRQRKDDMPTMPTALGEFPERRDLVE